MKAKRLYSSRKRIMRENKILITFVILGSIMTIVSIKMIMAYFTSTIATATVEKKNIYRSSSSSSSSPIFNFNMFSNKKKNVIALMKDSYTYKEEWLRRLYVFKEINDPIFTNIETIIKEKKDRHLHPRLWNIGKNNERIISSLFINQKNNTNATSIKQEIYYYVKSFDNTTNPPKYTGTLGQVDKYRFKKNGCILSKEWHTYNPITCNTIHEIDITSYIRLDYKDAPNMTMNVRLLSSGSQREAWVIPDIPYIPNNITTTDIINPIILKMFRYSKDYTEKKFFLNRIDALAVERLTSSKYVVDGYGYCGMTTLNEFADGGDFHTFINETESSHESNLTMQEKIIYARDAALGLNDIHSIYDTNDDNDTLATLVHRDIRSRNFLIIKNQLKYHDFNNAQFLTINTKSNQYCGYPRDQPCVITSFTDLYNCSPEEWMKDVYIDEKIDVYHLGTFFFKLLSNDYPYQYENMVGMAQSNEDFLVSFVLNEDHVPFLPSAGKFENEKDVYLHKRLVEIMNDAMSYNSSDRGSAKIIADQLVQLYRENYKI